MELSVDRNIPLIKTCYFRRHTNTWIHVNTYKHTCTYTFINFFLYPGNSSPLIFTCYNIYWYNMHVKIVTHIHSDVYWYTHRYLYTYIPTYAHTWVWTCIHTVNTQIHVCICMIMHIYTHLISMPIHIHEGMNTCTCPGMCSYLLLHTHMCIVTKTCI